MAELKIKTDANLLKRLGEAAQSTLSKEEVKKQRLSFIYAGMPKESGMSKVQIEKTLSKAS